MKRMRHTLAIVCVCLAVLCVGLALTSMVPRYASSLQISYEEKSRYNQEGPVIDKSGNLYYELSEWGSIQVYGNTGEFKYRIAFPKGFDWGLDEFGQVNALLYSYGGEAQYVIFRGDMLLEDRVVKHAEGQELLKECQQNQLEPIASYLLDGYRYYVDSIANTITVTNADGTEILSTTSVKGSMHPFVIFGVLGTICILGVFCFATGIRNEYMKLILWWRPGKKY